MADVSDSAPERVQSYIKLYLTFCNARNQHGQQTFESHQIVRTTVNCHYRHLPIQTH